MIPVPVEVARNTKNVAWKTDLAGHFHNRNKIMAKKRKVVSKHKRREKQLSQYPKPNYEVGDLIRVNDGVMDANWDDLPLGGWVGRIDKVHRQPDSPCYDVTWTPETLKLAHPVYEALAEEEGLNWDEFGGLLEDEFTRYQGEPIQLADPGDVACYCDRPLSKDHLIDRIRMVFGLKALEKIPSFGDDAPLKTYYDYLMKHLEFPFEATFVHTYANEKYPFTCQGIYNPDETDYGNDTYGLFCYGRNPDGTERECPLHDVLITKNIPQKQWIEDYCAWTSLF